MLVVVTPAPEKKLASLLSVKDELGITGSTYDALLTQYIVDATAVVQLRCDRDTFGSETVIETWRDVGRAESLIADRRPISNIGSIVEDGVTLTSGYYEVDGRHIYRMDGNDKRSIWCASKIVVSYTGGYALTGAAPEILARACRVLAKAKWYSRTRDPLVKAEEVPGVIRQDYWVGDAFSADPDGLPAEVAGALLRYRYE